MALFEWDNKYSVGNATMDSHHMRIFDIINGLHDAMKDGRGEEVVGRSLTELASYTKYHFDEEERLMERTGYPGIAGQKAAHKAFLDQISAYQAEVAKGNGLFVVSSVTMSTKDWLKQHILTMDMQYENYLKDA